MTIFVTKILIWDFIDMFTTEQKYEWLCSNLKITNIDYWEHDALISLPNNLYFVARNINEVATIDQAVEIAMRREGVL